MTVVLADADAAVAAALTGAGHRVERLAPAAARRRLARGQVDLVAAGPAAPARVLRAARRARVPAAVVAVSAAEAGALARLRRLPDRVIATGDAAAAGRGAVDAVADSGAGLERELRRTAAGPVPRRARLSRGRRRAAPAARPGRA